MPIRDWHGNVTAVVQAVNKVGSGVFSQRDAMFLEIFGVQVIFMVAFLFNLF